MSSEMCYLHVINYVHYVVLAEHDHELSLICMHIKCYVHPCNLVEKKLLYSINKTSNCDDTLMHCRQEIEGN